MNEFKSGFVAIIGRPNVGKSTLMNRLVGEKVAIMSDKPQTTRNAIKSILTGDDYQIVFIDTPGIHKAKTKLGEYMVKAAEETIWDVDAVMLLIEADSEKPGGGDQYIIEQLKKADIPVILVINKIDLVKKEELLSLIACYKDLLDFEEIIPISALRGEGTDIVIETLKKLLPAGPKFFPDDMLTDQPERQIAAEMIREKALRLLDEEVPHGIGVEILSMKDNETKGIVSIQANLYCEKDSHKAIIIGKSGSMLKRIGTDARKDLEKFLGTKVFLEIWVKVNRDWRNKSNMLREFGYE